MFNILHLSDFHFGSPPNRPGFDPKQKVTSLGRCLGGLRRNMFMTTYREDISEALSDFIWKKAPEIDVAVITGDVATTADIADLDLASDYVRRISEYDTPIFLLPGNHDRFADALCRPGELAFEQQFPAYWTSGSSVRHLVVEKDGMCLAVVGVDLSLKSEDGSQLSNLHLCGRGKAYEERIREARRRTARLREKYEGIGVIWAVHFPPEFPEQDDSLHLDSGSELLEAATAVGVDHILAGHRHAMRVYHCGNALVISAGTSMAAYRDNEVNVIHEVLMDVDSGNVTLREIIDHKFEESFGTFEQIKERRVAIV
ncbi:MAG: metallophosphoesterase [Alphaproteobacteria bacterium]